MANFDLSNLMEGKTPQSVMLEQTRALRNKWDRTGLLEGLKERDQHSMAVLLENQAKQLLDEATSTGTSSGSEEWSGVALPLVRRIFGEIASKEFVSVQPMNLPSGLIFYLDFKYGSAQDAKPGFEGKSLFGGNGTSTFNQDFGRTLDTTNGLYGEGRFGYTVNQLTTPNITTGNQTFTSASWGEVGYVGELSASVAAGTLKKLTVNAATVGLQLADKDAVRTFVVAGDDITEFYPQFSAFDGTNYIFVVESAAAAPANVATVTYSKIPTDYNRGDFEDKDPLNGAVAGQGIDSGTDLNIPEIDLELRSEAIVAKTRKLKAVWTPELAQDLNAYHSIDAEAELTSMLSDYISLEIDLEILDMLRSNALTTDYWSTVVGEEYNPNTGAFVNDGNALAYQKNTWFQTLGVKLNKVSNKIHQLTLRGGANFVVASPDVCTILESIPAFQITAEKDSAKFAAGVTQVGSLANRYTVYKNPYMTSNEILMGYRGNNFLETGAVYAPYVPLIMTPLVYDPQNFTPRRGVMTRYAKKMVRPEYYGRIFIKDLNRL
jgi:hypothetical protein